MLIGHIDRLDRHYLSGWALETDAPDIPIEVSVVVNGEEWGRVIANNPRSDLEAHGSYGNGCHGFTYLFDKTVALLDQYIINLIGHHDGKSSPIAQRPIRRYQPTIQKRIPILVTASGRSGTTILMKHLRTSPSILIPDKYPYELKLLTYYGHAFDILSSPGNEGEFSGNEGLHIDPKNVSLNPFNHHQFQDVFADTSTLYDFFERKAPVHLTAAFRAIISDFYDILGDKSGRQHSRYFAEKTDILHRARDFARIAFEAVREFILIRDPRDLFCSYRSFWKSRPEEAIPALKATAARILNIRRTNHQHDLIFIKYEDLILQKENTLARIGDFLGLGHALAPDIESDGILFKKHGTSADASSSVGRWKADLKDEEIRIFEDQFAEFFTTFEYGSGA